jgi:SAM-dependent methyltransferase
VTPDGRGRPDRWLLPDRRGWRPGLYEGFFTRTRWGRSLRRDELATIRVALAGCELRGRPVLEIGAGTGTYTEVLVRAGALVDVREPSRSMRSYLSRRADRDRWESVSIGDGGLPADLRVHSRFAVVLAIGVLNYLPELAAALTAMARVLETDGVVVVNVPTAERPAGGRYRRIERLGRRRVFCRDRDEVACCARAAGLRVDHGPLPAGVTDVYVLRPRTP